MDSVFRCNQCNQPLKGFPPLPRCPECGMEVAIDQGIYIFTNAPAVKEEGKNAYVGYDSIAEGYDRYLHPQELQNQLFSGYAKALKKVIPENGLLLDLGSGPGAYAIEIAKQGQRVIAGDISLKMLEILVSKMSSINNLPLVPCRLDAHSLPLQDRSIDVVIALNMLHFVGNPAHVVSEMKRVLKPEGKLVVSGRIQCDRDDNQKKTPTFGTISEYYREELKQGGFVEPRRLGWTSREIRERLPDYFSKKTVLENTHLDFRYEVTAGWCLAKLQHKYTRFQIGMDETLHNRGIQTAREQLRKEFGEGWEASKFRCHEKHTLDVYSNG